MKYFTLYHNGIMIAASDSLNQLIRYLVQKGEATLKCDVKIVKEKEIPENLFLSNYENYILTNDEIAIIEHQTEVQVEMFNDTVKTLEMMINVIKDKDENKKLKKALKIVNKYEKLMVGKTAKQIIVQDVAETSVVDLQTIREMDTEFRSKII